MFMMMIMMMMIRFLPHDIMHIHATFSSNIQSVRMTPVIHHVHGLGQNE